MWYSAGIPAADTATSIQTQTACGAHGDLLVPAVELVPAVAPLGSMLACTTALAACAVELAAGLAVAPLGCKLSCKAALAACVEANAASRDGCTTACVVAGTSQGGCATACQCALAAGMGMSAAGMSAGALAAGMGMSAAGMSAANFQVMSCPAKGPSYVLPR